MSGGTFLLISGAIVFAAGALSGALGTFLIMWLVL